MKWNRIKKYLCTALAVGLAAVSPLTAYAQTNSAAGVTQTGWPQPAKDLTEMTGFPVKTDVTEEEAAAFLKEYNKGLKKSETQAAGTAEAEAKKRASALTGLYGIDSVEYAIIDNGTIVFSGQSGYHVKATKQPVTQESMYGIASISKMFTTTAMMQLVDQGKIKLDNPVTDYIPEFTMADARYKDITVRMLLNHSSGLMGSTGKNWVLFNDNDTYYHDNLLKELKKQRLKADPGAFSVYCNDGFTLAELVIERVSKESFTSYISNHITDPLGMTNTKTPLDSFSRDKLAGTYAAKSSTAYPTECFNALGTGGLYSTAQDLCRLATVYMDSSASGGILSDSSRRAAMNEEYKNGLWIPEKSGFTDYGLGWDTVDVTAFEKNNIKALTKGGDSILYHSELIVLPEKNIAMAVTSSGGASTYNSIFAQGILLEYLEEKGQIASADTTAEKIVRDTAAVPDSLKSYNGLYGTSSAGDSVYINITDAGLTYTSASFPKEKMDFKYNSKGQFVDSTGVMAMTFRTEANGEDYMVAEQNMSLPGIGEMPLKMYMGQKQDANPLSDSVKKAWKARNNKLYFSLNEKYSSYVYPLSSIAQMFTVPEKLDGYLYSNKITDANHAEFCLQIPMQNGRDGMDFTFYKQAGTEYLKVSNQLYMSVDGIKALSSKPKFTVTIGSKSGHAKWYTIDKKTAGKKISVKLPKKGSFSVYASTGVCVNASYTSGKTSLTLPKDGYIVFAGDKNAKFSVSLSGTR